MIWVKRVSIVSRIKMRGIDCLIEGVIDDLLRRRYLYWILKSIRFFIDVNDVWKDKGNNKSNVIEVKKFKIFFRR